MKRHPALISLSHDHHQALVQARRLRRAADRDQDPNAAAEAFVAFFAAVSVPHLREEEETLFPLVADSDAARPLVVEELVFLVDGSARVTVDGEPRDLRRGEALIVAKGCQRKITAGRDGARYLSVHLRRPPLQIAGPSRHGSNG